MDQLSGITDSPLLDLPFGRDGAGAHPFIQASVHGKSGKPPAPFEALAEWAAEQFRSWSRGVADAHVDVNGWRYVRGDHPGEQLLHLSAQGTRYCFHKGREHRAQKVMITIDLLRHRAWQRCWDPECKHIHRRNGCQEQGDAAAKICYDVKAKHSLGRPPGH